MAIYQITIKNYNDERWTKQAYDAYIAGCVEVGAGSAYKLITRFNDNEAK